MNFSWYTSIDKLMYWRAGLWTAFQTESINLILRVHYDQLLITVDNKVLESLNMQCKMKGIFKEDILILIIWSKEQEIRKIKFQLKSNVGECLQKLGEHFPVVKHNSNQPPAQMKPKYRNLKTVLKHAYDKKGGGQMLEIPASYNNFVKLCLLDPAFPQIVIETEKILSLDINKQ